MRLPSRPRALGLEAAQSSGAEPGARAPGRALEVAGSGRRCPPLTSSCSSCSRMACRKALRSWLEDFWSNMPAWITFWSTFSLYLAAARIFSSTLLTVQSRRTRTSFCCPMRCARSCACRSCRGQGARVAQGFVFFSKPARDGFVLKNVVWGWGGPCSPPLGSQGTRVTRRGTGALSLGDRARAGNGGQNFGGPAPRLLEAVGQKELASGCPPAPGREDRGVFFGVL